MKRNSSRIDAARRAILLTCVSLCGHAACRGDGVTSDLFTSAGAATGGENATFGVSQATSTSSGDTSADGSVAGATDGVERSSSTASTGAAATARPEGNAASNSSSSGATAGDPSDTADGGIGGSSPSPDTTDASGGSVSDGGEAGAWHEDGTAVGGTGGVDGSGGAGGTGGVGGAGGAPPVDLKCSPTAPFTSMARQVFDVRGVIRARLTPDELTAYAATYSSTANWQIAVSERAARDDVFPAPVEVEGVNSAGLDLSPFLSHDGLTLYLESTRAGFDKLYVASRVHSEDSFSTPILAPGVSDRGDTSQSGGPYLSSSLKLYFQMVTSAGQHLYQAARDGAGWTAPVLVLDIGATVAFPVVTSDDLTVYFALRGPEGQWDIWVATRSNTAEAFDAAEPVVELNVAEDSEFPTWLSPDDCRLYFDRSPGGDWNRNAALMIERAPLEDRRELRAEAENFGSLRQRRRRSTTSSSVKTQWGLHAGS